MAVPTWAYMAIVFLIVVVGLVACLAAWVIVRRGKQPRGFEVLPGGNGAVREATDDSA